jgi:hypothetical protein
VRKRIIFLGILLVIATSAFGQIQIKVNDNVNLKFGLLLQSQGDATQDAATRQYANNVFIRRARILLGGQIAPNLTFFAETDSPNIGKSLTTGTKNQNVSMFLQDAYVEYKFSDAVALEAGLMLVSPSRNGLQSAGSLMALDYGAHTFANSAALQNSAGRDTGFQARGYLHNRKLEYRAGIFQGMRDTQDRELRTTFRVQYNFFDPETAYFYTGTYLGKKKVLAIGAGFDRQHKYDGVAADVFFDYPLKYGAITAQFDHITYNGKDFLKSLADQHDNLLEVGYLVGKTRLMPVVQVAKRDYVGKTAGDETRVGAGLNYFLNGHNANLKGLYTRVDGKGLKSATQFTVQLQFFYF